MDNTDPLAGLRPAVDPRDPRLVGADLMELSPPFDENARTEKLGARLLLEVLSARG